MRILHESSCFTEFITFITFCNKIYIVNHNGTQILDSISHMTLKLLSNHTFGVETPRFCHKYMTLWVSLHYVTQFLIDNCIIYFNINRYYTARRDFE